MRRLFLLLVALTVSLGAHAQLQPQPPTVAASAWLLYDMGSGQVLAGHNADTRVDPASLTKMMTAYVALSAVRQKSLTLEQTVQVSERAWKTGGSRMFIEPNRPVTVDELLKGMIIQSGNDASVALAEAVAGSEEAFAALMNREAQRLGLKNTRFANATGLSDPQHYSTAHDLSLIAAALIRDFPEGYALHAQKDYTYNKIRQPNRNRLLWLDPTVDGIKTGHTEAAGYCLAASAVRGPRRLIAVVMGTASEAVRAQEALKLLNFGFQFYETVALYRKDEPINELRVWKGERPTVKAGFQNDFVLALPKGQKERLKANLISQQPLIAPVSAGQRVGTLRLTMDDKLVGEYPIVALEAMPVAGLLGRMWDTVRLWFE